MRSTYIAKPAEIARGWVVIDADGQNLGRLSSEIASILRGKNKPIFTPHVDTGDNVIVINASKVAVTGKKLAQKKYRRHSGYAGGLKEVTLREMMNKKPEEVIRHAVKGMLPKNNLGHAMLKKLRVFSGPEHTHQAQKPVALSIDTSLKPKK